MERIGKTAYQKITEAHTVRVLPDGRLVLLLDRVWGHEITTPNAVLDMQARGIDVVFNPNKVKMMIDHVNPAKDTASAVQGKILRDWSKNHGVEFLDVGANGVCHAIIPEKGWILPGEIGIMGDSHTCTHGAFGAFTAGVGTTDLENGIITGLWVCPPQKVIRVNFVGKLPANVFAKDLVLELIRQIGVKGATNAVLEFGGNVIDEMSMGGRMTITNMAVEAGATSGMINVDKTTLKYFRPVLEKKYCPNATTGKAKDDTMRWNSDPDAEYDRIISIDVSGMEPQATINYSPADVVSVRDIVGKPVHQVYIGSCTNGRIEDLRIAAGILKYTGGKIAENTRCIIVPATQHIYDMALKEGLLETFLSAGCYISGPTCGACLGMSCGVLAPGEVCVSTTNRNFPGRMGKGGMVHLVSPATAAYTALSGSIADPPKELCEEALEFSRTVASWYKMGAMDLTEYKEVLRESPDYSQFLSRTVEGNGTDFSGKVFYLPADNIDTDQIIPAKYLTEIEKAKFGEHCLEDAPISAEDRPKLSQSQILVAGENFGCGSSREHAPWALESAGIRCVIAPSFPRIFENNMFANGLLCVTLPKEEIDILMNARPKKIEVDLEGKELHCVIHFDGDSCRADFEFSASDHQKDLIKNGGSVGVMLRLAAELQKEGKI